MCVYREAEEPDMSRPLGQERMSARNEIHLDEEIRCGVVKTRYVRGLLTFGVQKVSSTSQIAM
jgi:hypothetical protein